MARQLFGTDGIRGTAGEYPLDARTAHAAGAALGEWAREHSPEPQVLIGMDTRESGNWLAAQVAGGLERHGVRVRFAGILTTPGVAYLTRTGEFVAGVMISASHNPFHDNGIKVFDHSGFKLPDADELTLEQRIFAQLDSGVQPQAASLTVDETLDAQYLNYLFGTVITPLSGMSLVVDCGHGAASHLAPELFRRLGASLVAMGCQPDGRNINENCGALHLNGLRTAVLEAKADAGVAFDGDADRAMLVSGSGKLIDGDHVLLLTAMAMQRQGRLACDDGTPLVVATVMSNLGLQRALDAEGIQMVRTPVGDKYVLEEMIRRGAWLGGEQSGHVIFRHQATTGDGLLTALRVLEVMRHTGQSLDELTASFAVYPQRLVNVRVAEKRPLDQLPRVQEEIRRSEEAFGERGRILVRFSGTEPLARVMVEGAEEQMVVEHCDRLAAVLREELGGR